MVILYPNVSSVWDDIASGYVQKAFCSNVRAFATQRITGFVHVLPIKNAILITENFIPYLITADLLSEYKLNTGDKIDAEVAYSTLYDRHIVVSVSNISKVDYNDEHFIKSSRNFPIGNLQIALGTTTLVTVDEMTNMYDKVQAVTDNAPFGMTKIILSLDGRRENYDPKYQLFQTKLSYSNRDKLTVCLLAFFHAKELACKGKDVLLVVDSLDKMFYIYNNCMQRTGFIDPLFISVGAMTDLENIMRSGGCIKDKGTLTIIGLYKKGITAAQKFATQRFYQVFDLTC